MMMSTRVDGEVADDSSSSGSSDDGMGPESPSPVIAHYELIVRQQPVRARMSGYNNKDRRPIDPTPIVQLTARSAEGKQLDVSYLKSPFMVLYASLWSADKTTEFTFGFGDSQIPPNSNDNTPPPPQPPPSQVSATIRVDNVTHFPMASSPSSQSHSSSSISDEKPTILEGIQQSSLSSSSSSNGEAPRVNAAAARAPKPLAPPLPVLLGSLVSSCYILRDENGMKGLFFVFPDMGVRTSGKYRLKFNLFVVEAVDLGFRLTQAAEAAQAAASPSSAGLDDDSLKKTKVKTSFPSSSKSPCASVFSNVFKVYSPKSFPGMAASTALSKLFAKQGVRIHLRADAHTQRGDPNRNPQHRHSKSGGSSGAGGGSSGT
ncbi:velvet factor [Powellomyces hirtus]|nr:velvet factor [Powellomyces hirtus]